MPRILVIDDDTALLPMLADLLRADGHEVATASDGMAAEKLFRETPFDLILTDIIMPNREGLETVAALRKDFPRVALIAMSGWADLSKTYLKVASRLGAHRTLLKPFTPAELRAAVIAALENAASAPPRV